MSTAEAVATQVRKQLVFTRVARYTPWILSGAAIVFALLCVLVLAQPCGDTGCTGTQTNFGSAVHDPQDFLATLLDGLTSAGVYFVVASGFTLIFGLIDVALILVLASTVNGSPGLAKAGGIVVFAFAVVGAYVFAGSLSVATGGKPFPLGRPVIT